MWKVLCLELQLRLEMADSVVNVVMAGSRSRRDLGLSPILGLERGEYGLHLRYSIPADK